MAMPPTLPADTGLLLLPSATSGIVNRLDRLAAGIPQRHGGTRLVGGDWAEIAADGPIADAARTLLPGAMPVRAILFDKSAASNWALGWHQDRVIAVRARHDVPGYGPWTVKSGIVHVAPPAALLATMITLRVHLDDVDADNAPLLAAAGSHRLGRIAEDDIAGIVRNSPIATCTAARGDIWAYASLLLHASDRATRPRRRRVLHIDYAAAPLPRPLAWAGL